VTFPKAQPVDANTDALGNADWRPQSLTRLPALYTPDYAFFMPVALLSRVFRGNFIAGLMRAVHAGELMSPAV